MQKSGSGPEEIHMEDVEDAQTRVRKQRDHIMTSAEASGTTASPSPSSSSSSSNSSKASGFQSTKMMEAQSYFQKVVKQELQVLLESGVEREVAVKMLLHRIVESTDEPPEEDVRHVMKQFQMNYDDAVRALIVKQELGRLKRKGLDSFAAIEELTRKMQRVGMPDLIDATTTMEAQASEVDCVEEVDEEKEEEVEDEKNANNDTAIHSSDEMEGDDEELQQQRSSVSSSSEEGSGQDDANVDGKDNEGATAGMEDALHHIDDEAGHKASSLVRPVAVSPPEATIGSDSPVDSESDPKNLNLSSLSLCQRIDKVSISTSQSSEGNIGSSTDEERRNNSTSRASSNRHDIQDGAKTVLSQPQSPASSSGFTSSIQTSTPSRKRRGSFTDDKCNNPDRAIGNEDESGILKHRRSSNHKKSGKKSSKPSFELFPNAKKQKLCVEVGDGFLTMRSRKSSKQQSSSIDPTKTPTPATPTNSNSPDVQSQTNTNSMNRHKRHHAAMSGATASASSGGESPIMDDLSFIADHFIRHTKRHKTQRYDQVNE